MSGSIEAGAVAEAIEKSGTVVDARAEAMVGMEAVAAVANEVAEAVGLANLATGVGG